jgi:MraZ protein
MRFKGSHEHSLDQKGRVSIPAGFRTEIQRLGGDSAPILTRGKDHLVLYPGDVWDEIMEDLTSKSSFNPDVQALERFVIGGAADCPIDAQGRITIPATLRAHADLNGKVTLVGLSKKIEIWNNERIEIAQQTTLGRLETIQMAVDQSTSGP